MSVNQTGWIFFPYNHISFSQLYLMLICMFMFKQQKTLQLHIWQQKLHIYGSLFFAPAVHIWQISLICHRGKMFQHTFTFLIIMIMDLLINEFLSSCLYSWPLYNYYDCCVYVPYFWILKKLLETHHCLYDSL